MRASWRRGWPAAVIAGAAVLAVTVVLLARAPAPGSASWTGWLNSGLENYADTAGQWNSGDNAVQVALPGGRALWLFNDSYYGFTQASATADCASAGTGCIQWGVGLLDASCPAATGMSACTYIYGEVWPSPEASSRRSTRSRFQVPNSRSTGTWSSGRVQPGR